MDSSEISIGSVIKSAVTDTIETNASFQSSAGIRAKIKRVAHAGCCDECRALSGEWYYSEAPKGVYWRHGNCSCTVTYDPGTGKVQNVHTKQWQSADAGETLERKLDEAVPTISDFRIELNQRGIEYKNVGSLKASLTSDEIISKVGGEDLTAGSCVSAALAYIGNAAGYDVLDFRGGDSREFFSSRIAEIGELKGVGAFKTAAVDIANATMELLEKHVAEGKTYCLVAGSHAAIVRRTSDGFEFLELQTFDENGWHPLTKSDLEQRFGCFKIKRQEQASLLIDAEALGKSDEFKIILGYINTKDQRKGSNSYGK